MSASGSGSASGRQLESLREPVRPPRLTEAQADPEPPTQRHLREQRALRLLRESEERLGRGRG